MLQFKDTFLTPFSELLIDNVRSQLEWVKNHIETHPLFLRTYSFCLTLTISIQVSTLSSAMSGELSGAEGFVTEEEQETIQKIEKNLKRRFAVGSQVSWLYNTYLLVYLVYNP